MIKVIQPHAQDFSEPVAALIKVSSRGLIGHDRATFVKRAGAEFAQKLENIKFAKDEIPVHMIAIGATEDYGPNRNGDGFTRDCCRDYHRTFEKFARFYRDHANKNPAKSFGIVKASAYHEPMHRIELIVALNGSKEAAERNGGLLADREMEKLAADKDIAVSMACKIPFDVCSSCGNKAKTRAEYCDSTDVGGFCKAGGLKHNIGRVLADGHVLHADNPNPTFFDISHVFRPADRIAYVSGTLQKAAAASFVSGAELAEQLGVTSPLGLGAEDVSKNATAQLSALQQLVQAEQLGSANWTQIALAADLSVQPHLAASETPAKTAEVLSGLTRAGVILPVRDFLALTIKTATQDVVAAVSHAAQGIFSKIAAHPDVVTLLETNPYTPVGAVSLPVQVWAEKVAQTHSILPKNTEKRAYLAALRGAVPPPLVLEKQAASAAAAALAEHYGLYKIAAFAAICGKRENNLLTANHIVLQNYVM